MPVQVHMHCNTLNPTDSIDLQVSLNPLGKSSKGHQIIFCVKLVRDSLRWYDLWDIGRAANPTILSDFFTTPSLISAKMRKLDRGRQ